MKILIVDDDTKRSTELRDFLLSALPSLTTSIVCCDNASSAKELMRESYFDALVLDVVLPRRRKETPNPQYGLDLLQQLSRSPTLRKPEKIIGITSHTEDLANFRDQFLNFCVVVVEANPVTPWKVQIASSLGYTDSSKLIRSLSEQPTVVLTVHGIRTYGQWQTRLRELVANRTDMVEFQNYKYGYFSILAFLLPPIRWLQVSRLVSRFQSISADLKDRRIVVFCHSFGTYLVASSVKKLLREHDAEATLVLCGSVLPSNFDWSFLDGKRVNIINDCGDSDYVLWAASAFALGLGMAGKVGFYGFNNSRVVNRFFRGSHSHYFDGNTFMEKRWIPILSSTNVTEVDERSNANSLEIALQGFINFIALIKPVLYLTPLLILVAIYL